MGGNQSAFQSAEERFVHVAAYKGNVRMIKKLLADGVDINYKSEISNHRSFGSTALIEASATGHLKCVQLLCEAGADLEITDVTGKTAFLYACEENKIKVARYLIDRNVDINKGDDHGNTALMLASFNNNLKLVEMLCNAGTDLNLQTKQEYSIGAGNTALHEACRKGNNDVAKLLIDKGSDVNIVNKDNKTAVMNALSSIYVHNNLPLVKLLCEAGADLSIKDKYSNTVLHRACDKDSTAILEYLLEKGADRKVGEPLLVYCARYHLLTPMKVLLEHGEDINQSDGLGNTPITNGYDNEEIIQFLLSNGSNVNQETHSGESALLLASHRDNTDVLNLLLNNGANVNHTQFNGLTALMISSRSGYTENVRLLLAHGADVNIQTTTHHTALLSAVRVGYYNIVKLLCQHGADVNVLPNNEASALLFAINQSRQMVEILLIYGADTQLKYKHDKTALDVAKEVGDQPIIDLLISVVQGAQIVSPLKQWCRRFIRQLVINTEEIEQLPVATPLKDYLKFQ